MFIRRQVWAVGAALLLVPRLAAAGIACVGDCDGDGVVAVYELITGVNIALGSQLLDWCPLFDESGDGMVATNELITGVNIALAGCPMTDTPTVPPAGTASATVTMTATPVDSATLSATAEASVTVTPSDATSQTAPPTDTFTPTPTLYDIFSTATQTNTATPTNTPVPIYGSPPPSVLAVVAVVAPSSAGYDKTQLTVTGARFGITGTRSVELFHDGTSTVIPSGDARVTAWFDDYIELTLLTRATALSASVTRDGVASAPPVTAEVYEWTALHVPGFMVASNVLDVDDNGIVWFQPEFTTGFVSYDPATGNWGAYPFPVPTVSATGHCSGADVELHCTGTGGGTCPAGDLCIHPGNIFAAESQLSLMGEDVHVTPDGAVWTGYGGYSGYAGPWPNHSIIMRYDPTTGNKRVYNLPGENNSIKGMAWDAARNLWWVGQQGGIIAFDPDTTPWTNPAFDYGSSNDDLWCENITTPINGCYRFYAQDLIANPVETGLVELAPDGTVWWTMFGCGCWSDPTWPYPHVLGHLDPDTGVIEHYPIPAQGCQTGLGFDTNGDVYFSDSRRNWMMKLDHTDIGNATCFALDGNGNNPCFTINPMPHVNPLQDEEFLSIFGVTTDRLWWAIWQGIATREQGFIGWVDRATGQYVRFPYPHDLPGTDQYAMTSYCPAWLERLVNGDIWTNDFYNGGLVRYLFRGSTPPPATFTPTGPPAGTASATVTMTATPVDSATPSATAEASVTVTPSDATSQTAPPTDTFTPTPTLAPDCRYDIFTIAASADDGYLSKTNAAGAWPPPGGSGPTDVTTAHSEIRVVIEGASNTAGAYVMAFGDPPGIPWPAVLNNAANADWGVYNLGVNSQTTVDFRAADPSLPWVETANHQKCSGITEDMWSPFCTTDDYCAPETCSAGGGASGLESDLAKLDPDVVIFEPASNDALWANLYGGGPLGQQSELTNFPPSEIVNRLVWQCDAVAAHNALTHCLVTTVGKGPYVADDPWTSNYIDEVNAGIRAAFPADHVVDFDTNSSNVSDYVFESGMCDYVHRWQRLLNQNAARVLAALTRTTATTTAPSLSAEAAKWNGTTTRSVAVMRWDTSTIPADYEPVGAQLTVHASYIGATAQAGSRNIGIQWANNEAADGWSSADYPSSLTSDAYIGSSPAITTTEYRGLTWSFALDSPQTISRTGYTGLLAGITPDTIPGADEYFTADLIASDDPLNTGQGPVLSVFSCRIPETAARPLP